ncbi:hypothetical protein AUJ66_02920 [Candidatus Desantisbacteria bacterium CG1_02_38_46]|uniref:Ligand-binding protein SH3 n=1 Tax=Candidatus Desantisbacteria bacterium CG1_02_38_46 TaxID=1817893 RepID=A0A1J4SDN2_9BACT|nr:MAG: hypothetical protein AUJ66_02920 [Candidatus Desantisbacteria bacterium CG1_02_38_46]
MRVPVTYGLFLLLYIFGSRIIFIPAGMAFGVGKYVILFLVFFLDILQIPFYFYIYEKGASKIKFLSKMESSKLLKFAQSLGSFGVVLVAAMPAFGGGMWSSVLISFLLGLDRKKSILLLALGSLLGCMGVVFGIDGLIHLFKV